MTKNALKICEFDFIQQLYGARYRQNVFTFHKLLTSIADAPNNTLSVAYHVNDSDYFCSFFNYFTRTPKKIAFHRPISIFNTKCTSCKRVLN